MQYEPARLHFRRGVDLGAEGSFPLVLSALSQVVDTETPVSYEVALARIKAANGTARAGRRIREAFSSAVETLKSQGKIRMDRRRFLWSAKTDKVLVVRAPRDGDPATARKVSDVPPEEMRLAVLRLLTDAITAGRDELTFRTARLFGWNRRGSDIGRALDTAVTSLVKEGLVAKQGDLLRVLPR